MEVLLSHIIPYDCYCQRLTEQGNRTRDLESQRKERTEIKEKTAKSEMEMENRKIRMAVSSVVLT